MQIEGGEIRAELLDVGGSVIPGYSKDKCSPMTTSGARLEVRWQGDPSPTAELLSTPLRLRLHLRKATIHGFQFGR